MIVRMNDRMGCMGWFLLIQISHMVYKGGDNVETSSADSIVVAKGIYQLALKHAFARHPDTGLELVFDRKKRASYVKCTKDFADGALTIVPRGPGVKVRTAVYGEQLGHFESFIFNNADGSRVICSPVAKSFCCATVSHTTKRGMGRDNVQYAS